MLHATQTASSPIQAPLDRSAASNEPSILRPIGAAPKRYKHLEPLSDVLRERLIAPGDADYRTAFLRNRRATTDGRSLKDFDLNTRLFKYRCSYMIYSPVFEGLPMLVKQRVFARMNGALTGQDPEFAYLPAAERQAIREILRATLEPFPAD